MCTFYNIKAGGNMGKNLGRGGQDYLKDSTILAFTSRDYAIHNIYMYTNSVTTQGTLEKI
jgi:hypothetical protein